MRQFLSVVLLIGVFACGPTPAPPPEPDVPVDAERARLRKSFQDAYNAETDVGKKVKSKYIAKVFRDATATVNTCKTAGELFDAISKALHDPVKGFPKGEMKTVMKAVGAHLNLKLGTSPLAELDKRSARKALSDTADAMESVKK